MDEFHRAQYATHLTQRSTVVVLIFIVCANGRNLKLSITRIWVTQKGIYYAFTLNRDIAIYSIDNQFFVTIFLLNDKLIMMSVTKRR